MLLLKSYLQAKGLKDVYTGGLGSFSLTIMVVFYLEVSICYPLVTSWVLSFHSNEESSFWWLVDLYNRFLLCPDKSGALSKVKCQMLSLNFFIFNGVILYISGREFVVLHATPSMYGKFVVHAWWYCGGLNEEHSISGQ